INQRSLSEAIGKQARVPWQFTRARQNDAPRLPGLLRVTSCQSRIVDPNRRCTDNDCINLRAQRVRMLACGGARYPTRLTRTSGQPSVQAHPALGDNKRLASDDPFIESFVEGSAFLGQNADP